jgi:hypothetical protein
MKKLLAMLVMMAAVFTVFNIAQAGQGRDYDQAREVDQCTLAFSQHDVDNTGRISYQQFGNAWYGLGSMKGITPYAMPQAYSTDRDGDGFISHNEFCARWYRNTINPRMSG